MTKLERLDWIDLSKGFGIILVVYGHVARGLNSAGLGFELFRQIDNVIYAFHMPLFFLLSGYFFLKSSEVGALSYFKSKVSTILFPYLIWSLIQIVIMFFASNYTNGTISLNDVLTFFLPRGQFWFLLALFFISTVNIILFSKFGSVGLIVSSVISLLYILIGTEILVKDLKIFDDTLGNLLFFNVGILLYKEKSLLEHLVKRRFSFLVNTILFLSLESVLFIKGIDFSFFNLVLAISGSLFVLQISNLNMFRSNHLKEIGRQSLTIYILHILVGSGSRIILMKIFKIDNVFINVVIGTTLGVYVPFLIYKLGLLKRISFLFKFPISDKKLLTTRAYK